MTQIISDTEEGIKKGGGRKEKGEREEERKKIKTQSKGEKGRELNK